MSKSRTTRRGFLAAGGMAASGTALAQSPFGTTPGDGPGVPPKVLAAALRNGCTSDPEHERVLIRYTRGIGQLSTPVRQFIYLRMAMFTLDGRADGFHEGVWQALFSNLGQLLAVPEWSLNPPTNPLTGPVGPVPSPAPLANTVAHWTFHDGSRLYAEGPALSHLVPLSSGASNFSVACSQILTDKGSGYFAGAHGLKQSLGATAVAPGVNFFDPAQTPQPFFATTLDTFRIVWPGGVPAGFDKEFGS